jgi:vanillate O-demethylase ferredoxin subunit
MRARKKSAAGRRDPPERIRNKTMTQRVTVREIRQETPDIRSFELESADGTPLAAYTPGAHIDVHVAPGIIRQYSLYEPPGASTSYFIAVKREPQSRGGSAGIHERVNVGDTLTVGVPRNNFALADNAQHNVLLAGGIGVTPIVSMAGHLRGTGASYDLHYFARSAAEAALLTRLQQEHGERLRAHHIDPAQVAQRLNHIIPAYRPGTHLYLCGPAPFMSLVRETVRDWPTDAVHFEYFVNDLLETPSEAGAFTVELARSGKSFAVGPTETILDVLSANGVEVPTSCEQGVCGTCITKVLQGRPDHLDVFMTDEEHAENDKITICVSRCLDGRLVLDL